MQLATEERRLVLREDVDPDEQWPLRLACANHNLAVVQYLIEEVGACLEFRDDLGSPILLLACDGTPDCIPIVRYLIERAGRSVGDRNRMGNTPLHKACEVGNLDLIQYLVEEAQANVEIANVYGDTPLHSVLIEYRENFDCYQVVRYLVERAGSNVYATNRDGNTPLHFACDLDNLESAKYLVEHGRAKVDTKNRFCESPLRSLCDYRRPFTDEFLVGCLRKVDSVGDDILVVACEMEHNWNVKAMVLRKYAVGLGLSGEFDKFPIHTIFRHFPLSKFALKECVERLPLTALSLCDHDGRLPVHLAMMSPTDRVAAFEVVSALATRMPQSLQIRDPITGMCPIHVAALFLSSEGKRLRELGWVNTMFFMLRINPVALCHAVRGVQVGGSGAPCNARSGSVGEDRDGVDSKKRKRFHCY